VDKGDESNGDLCGELHMLFNPSLGEGARASMKAFILGEGARRSIKSKFRGWCESRDSRGR
jgi:hypothetical protein